MGESCENQRREREEQHVSLLASKEGWEVSFLRVSCELLYDKETLTMLLLFPFPTLPFIN